MPVTGRNRILNFKLSTAHAALNAVVNARRIADNEGRAIIGFRLSNGLGSLRIVGTHRALCNIDIAIAHSDSRKILLLDFLTSSGKLRNRASRSCLGGLTAGVGINLGIKDNDIDVLALCQNVIQTAITNIIGPAVATEDEDRLLGEVILLLEDVFANLVVLKR
ncbi:hypothetical protein SDC9_154764 [bioreactor metagenome]|uniref:Uncharacterized protein n=1 Tax=bioreactor metagenome TaxID=1076179 RepID=A0A645F4F6_9ZZZZ